MKIVIANDDGVRSEGIRVLAETLAPVHEVYVVAPDRNRSAVSHSFTMREALHVDGPVEEAGVTWYSCSGTPSDCIHLALGGLFDFQPDVVLSGINHGENLGTDLVYSGTAAAARHAVMAGVPGIAVSMGYPDGEWNFKPMADFVLNNLEKLISLCGKEIFVNVNGAPLQEYSGWKLTEPAIRIYNDRLDFYDAPDGRKYVFKILGKVGSVRTGNTDVEAVEEGFVSVSRIHCQPRAFSDGDDR